MKDNKTWKDYIWTIPSIGVILIFIGFLTPTAYYKFLYIQEFFWMWGLNYRSTGMVSVLEFFYNAYEIFIPSLICFIILFILFIMLINSIKKEKKNQKSAINSLLIVGTSIIIIIIIYMITMEIGVSLFAQRYYGPGLYNSFWRSYIASFGIVGPILGGVLSIVGGLVSKYDEKIKEAVVPKPKDHIDEVKREKLPMTKPPHKYYANCGAELKGIFCEVCGTKA